MTEQFNPYLKVSTPECYSAYPVQFEVVCARGCPTCPVYKDCYYSTAKSENEKRNA